LPFSHSIPKIRISEILNSKYQKIQPSKKTTIQPSKKTYIAIDLKSFYASVECVERGLNPLNTNLVVADPSRTDKTICLAVSPSLKAYGIGGRARLFQVVQRMGQVNSERWMAAGGRYTGKSYFDDELKAHPDWQVDYIVAPPRMGHYITVSTKIYETYLKYIAPEDIHVYSIDEVFIDASNYLDTYKTTARQLAMTMIRDVLASTGITATAGIGTNMYLCKVAMDIVAKHMPADNDGVRIAELDEICYRRLLWNHRPLTDFWRVGHGIATRLAEHGIDTMGKIARTSIENEDLLYRLFGVNAELLIDHAWGWEPCTMEMVKRYRPTSNSLSSGQVLQEPYSWDSARIVVHEMADAIALDLVARRMVTDQLTLTIGYDVESLRDPARRSLYIGPVVKDLYGRSVPKHSHGTANLESPSSSEKTISEAVLGLYDNITNRNLLIRRINITTNHVVTEGKNASRLSLVSSQLDLFEDHEAVEREQAAKRKALEKERRLQEAKLAIKQRFGKNAILKGLNFEEGATARDRNRQIGGHRDDE
jgi:DNA polymerase V